MLTSFLLPMLNSDPDKRATASQALLHPWLHTSDYTSYLPSISQSLAANNPHAIHDTSYTQDETELPNHSHFHGDALHSELSNEALAQYLAEHGEEEDIDGNGSEHEDEETAAAAAAAYHASMQHHSHLHTHPPPHHYAPPQPLMSQYASSGIPYHGDPYSFDGTNASELREYARRLHEAGITPEEYYRMTQAGLLGNIGDLEADADYEAYEDGEQEEEGDEADMDGMEELDEDTEFSPEFASQLAAHLAANPALANEIDLHDLAAALPQLASTLQAMQSQQQEIHAIHGLDDNAYGEGEEGDDGEEEEEEEGSEQETDEIRGAYIEVVDEDHTQITQEDEDNANIDVNDTQADAPLPSLPVDTIAQ